MASELWKPGSFTKNFSWREDAVGLVGLYDNIRLGFAGELRNVSRQTYRQRVRDAGRPDYIPINFFLFNRPGRREGQDEILVDELVFQALTSEHTPLFDNLAIFAFNFSYVGAWTGQREGQRRPALWALNYVRDRVAGAFEWDTSRVNADDIERYMLGDSRYQAQGARKLSTNLNYLYRKGGLGRLTEERINRAYVDAVFLALDRLTEDRRLSGWRTAPNEMGRLLAESEFAGITGGQTLEKRTALSHLLRLYNICGGIERFDEGRVRARIEALREDPSVGVPNDDRPRGAVHASNPRILKSIPWLCSPLAAAAGFHILSPEDMAEFDERAFIRDHTRAALTSLRRDEVVPTLTARELRRLTRD